MGATASIQIPTQKPADPPAPDPKSGKVTGTGGVALTDPDATGKALQNKDKPKEGDGQAVERPDYIPEKFWTGNLEESAKKMAASYTELEKNQGKPKEKPADAPKDTPAAAADQNKVEQLYTKATQEYAERGGSISPEMYNEFQAAGISPRTVNDYIEGREAANSMRRNQLVESAGSEEVLNAALEWAGQSLTPEEAEWYNQAFNGQSAKAAQRAMRSLIADYQENGQEPTLISGESAGDGQRGGSSVQPFVSMNEQVKAQSDPRYRTDPAYRQEVDNRVRAVLARGGYGNVRRR